jgi:hypothetical protein
MSQSALVLIVTLFASFGSSMAHAQTQPATSPAAPDFGPNVLVLDSSTPDMQQRLDAIYKTQEAGQFNDRRFAILFKPGSYKLDVQVGFYTHVLGLGRSPDDVSITGAVRSKAKWMRNNNATCNFWRAVENLSVTPAVEGNANVWAVSQGTAMRRVHVKGDLHLSDGGWSSGGFLADSLIDGTVNSGSQQQWISRNDDWGQWQGGNWNMVFVGVGKPPEGAWPAQPFTAVGETPIIREKPYLIVDEASRYWVHVPSVTKDTTGISWKNGPTPGKSIPLDDFFIAQAGRDDAASINGALASGKHLLLTPGIYHLADTIRVQRQGTVVLGIGYPTLIPVKGIPAMAVADADGMSIAGILFEAGANESPTLLEVGEPGKAGSRGDNPIGLYDIFCRAGGATVGMTHCFVTIHASNVIGDNFWLWRADHGAGAAWDQNRNANGLVVNGNDVTIYGLMVEHTQQYQTLWNGERGRVYLYQCEMPYDPPSAEAWSHDGVVGYAAYKVADHVSTHEAWGLGVYTVFNHAPIMAQTAIEAPTAAGVMFHHVITCRLSGKPGSGIRHILNDTGDAVTDQERARLN